MTQMVKNLPVDAGGSVQSLGQEDPLERGNVYPLQYSCLGNPMDRGVWWSAIHGLAESRIGLSDEHFHFSLD